jgi:hypothetical protein
LAIDIHLAKATRARNHLAYKGGTTNRSIEELVAIIEVTTAIVILNVLHELGLSGERQRQIVQEITRGSGRRRRLRASGWLLQSPTLSNLASADIYPVRLSLLNL